MKVGLKFAKIFFHILKSTRVNPSPNNNRSSHIFNGNNRLSGRFGEHR